jgi:predicted nucleic acid-binding protein
VIITDANILLYTSFSTFRQHDAAKTWLEQQSSGSPVGLPWTSLSKWSHRDGMMIEE